MWTTKHGFEFRYQPDPIADPERSNTRPFEQPDHSNNPPWAA